MLVQVCGLRLLRAKGPLDRRVNRGRRLSLAGRCGGAGRPTTGRPRWFNPIRSLCSDWPGREPTPRQPRRAGKPTRPEVEWGGAAARGGPRPRPPPTRGGSPWPVTPRQPASRRPTGVASPAPAGRPRPRRARGAWPSSSAHYWYPIYALIRRKGHDADASLDLTQEYFARLLEKGTVAAADPAEGRFRSFLLADCSFFLADRRDRDRALKRGGGRPVLSIDARDAEGRFLREPCHDRTPERMFERDWALALIARVFDGLERHYADTGRSELFRLLKPLVSSGPDAVARAAVAAGLGMTEANLRVVLHRLRARFAARLREEVAATLRDAGDEAIEEELRRSSRSLAHDSKILSRGCCNVSPPAPYSLSGAMIARAQRRRGKKGGFPGEGEAPSEPASAGAVGNEARTEPRPFGFEPVGPAQSPTDNASFPRPGVPAMTHPDRCPECGAERSAGTCPRCLIRLGIDGPGPGRSRPSSPDDPTGLPGDATTAPGVLDSIAASIGAVPRVLLRDTAPGEEPGPIVRPQGGADADPSIRYRIDGEIARGGMGSVLKGRDPDLGRDVALKVLRDDLRDDAGMVRRFVEEAQIGGQLQHPGIVPIYELGTFADLRPFFAMKLVKGHTLAQLLEARDGPGDDRPRFLSIFESIAQTVAYTHARGVIHRDLKPSNVMVGSFGEVQVMDWGLAKVLPRGGVVDDQKAGKDDRQETVIATARSGSDAPGLSRPGSAMGTPAYMAPEQARGEGARVDERADVFAPGLNPL